MSSYKQLFHSAILFGSLGLATMLLGSPSCKAQEANPDHFTETGVQNVYENASAAPAKVTASGARQKQISSRVQKRQTALVADRRKDARASKQIVAELRQ